MDKIKHCGLGHLILVKVTQFNCSEKIILIEFCVQFQKNVIFFLIVFFTEKNFIPAKKMMKMRVIIKLHFLTDLVIEPEELMCQSIQGKIVCRNFLKMTSLFALMIKNNLFKNIIIEFCFL